MKSAIVLLALTGLVVLAFMSLAPGIMAVALDQTVQDTYNDQSFLPALEGGIVDTGGDQFIATKTGSGDTAQVTTIALAGSPGNATTYTVSVDEVPISYTTDASGTLAETYAGLLAALQADGYVTAVATVTGNGSNLITLTAVTAGVPFTVAKVLDVAGILTLATPTANVTGASIPVGRVLAQTTAGDNVVSLPSATGFTIAGVSVLRAKARPQNKQEIEGVVYESGWPIPTMRKGRVWLLTEDAADPSKTVYVRHTLGSDPSFTPGRIRASDDSGKVDAWSTAKFISSAGAGELVKVEFMIPV